MAKNHITEEMLEKRMKELEQRDNEPKKITAHEAIHSHKKHISYKWLYLIPVIILLYLGYANFIQSHDFNYFFDMGSLQDQKTSYITPADRVSNIENNESRNITKDLTYLIVRTPKGSKSVQIQLRFKDNFKNDTKIMIGYQNDSIWSYRNNLIYDYSQEVFSDYEKIPNDTYTIYKLSDKSFNNPRIQSDLRIPVRFAMENFQDHSTIDIGLRGQHTFYVYLNGSLNLSVIKQDINWYNGSDVLTIALYDLSGNLIANTNIEDDGINITNSNTSVEQIGSLYVNNVKGVYEIRFSDFDGIIRRIDINTNKIITNKLFLADNDLYVANSSKNDTIYFKSFGYSTMRYVTYHKEGYQIIKIGNDYLNISKTQQVFEYYTFNDSNTIVCSNNDIVISITNGYLSFGEDMFFEPFLSVEPVDSSHLENIDYVILPKTNYTSVKRDGDWLIATTNFKLENAYINKNQLSFLINIPHLSKYPNATIPIDWINITVYKYGIFQR